MTSVQSEPAMEALAGLLNEFRHGNIVARSAEKQGMRRHAGPLSARWNQRFPGFPGKYFPYTSFRGEFYRKHRDAHLKDIIVQMLASCGGEASAPRRCKRTCFEGPCRTGYFQGRVIALR
jgi:hypothetical protein